MGGCCQSIKNLLKKFLPMPANSLNREFTSIRTRLSKIGNQEDLLAQRLRQLDNQQTDTKNQLTQIAKHVDTQQAATEQLSKQIIEHIDSQQVNTEKLSKQVVEHIDSQKTDTENRLKQVIKRIDDQQAGHENRLKQVTERIDKQQANTEKLSKQVLEHIDSHQANAEQLSKQVTSQQVATENQLKQVTQQISNLQKQIDNLHKKIEEQKLSISNNRAEAKQQEESLTKNLTQLKGSLAKIESRTPSPILWSSNFERNVVKENWGDVTAREDFAEKFVKLTKGLDSKSVQAIVRILSRQKAYLNSEAQSLNLFTRAEQEEIRLLRENFNSEILKLSDKLFAYRNYLLPINHFESSVFYFKHGIDEVETLNKVKGKSVIDVGGFIGDSVLIFNELNPKRIYTFEASPENFELMRQTLKLNDVKNVNAENVALGAEKGMCTIHMAGSGTTTIDRPGLDYTGDIEVPTITLDDYVAEQKVNDIGLIKVDIEGGEPSFLAGAKRTICTQRPILLVSIYHNAHDFFELKPLIESWNLGYKFKIHKPTFGNATSETLLIAEVPDK